MGREITSGSPAAVAAVDPPPSLAATELVINPAKIAFLRFILEGYDGLATLSTLDEKTGLVILRYCPEVANEVAALLADLSPALAGPALPAVAAVQTPPSPLDAQPHNPA